MARNDASNNTALRDGLMAPLGPNIKHAQADKGLTVDALAAEIGVSPRLLQKWRQGTVKPRYENLLKLAAALDRDPAWFYTDHQREAA